MAIRECIIEGKKYYEVYVNGFNARGERVQRKRSKLETLRKAEVMEFELKRELAILKLPLILAGKSGLKTVCTL